MASVVGQDVPASVQIALLNGFELRRAGSSLNLSSAAERVTAYLALHNRPVTRLHLAGTLWPDVPERRSSANLRSALWRLGRSAGKLIESHGERLQLLSGTWVDLREAETLARRVVEEPLRVEMMGVDWRLLTGDVLPEWYDEWIALDRERFRQLRLQALEIICQRFAEIGRFPQAIEAGIAAVSVEPLRESSRRVLIRAHLAQGNQAAAVGEYVEYSHLLMAELGLKPSSQLLKLVEAAGIGSGRK